jgi:hypothetical protein
VAVIGPTTPLSPVLFDYGVDVLCGSLADDPLLVVESVAAGATGRIPGMRQVSLRRQRCTADGAPVPSRTSERLE